MELLEVIAYQDYSTAIELAKTYVFINTNVNLIGFYANLYDLPTSSTLLNFHQSLLNNLFLVDLHLSIQLQYYNDAYTFPVALYKAAIYGSIQLLMSFESKIGKKQKKIIDSILYLRGRKPIFFDRSRLFRLEETLDLINVYGDINLLDKEIIYSDGATLYEYTFIKSMRLELEDLIGGVVLDSQVIADGIAMSGNLEILDDLPKDFPFTKEELLATKLGNFPFNLKTKEQVQYYKADILKISAEVSEQITNHADLIVSYEALVEIHKLVAENEKKKDLPTLGYYFHNTVPFEERLKCLDFLAKGNIRDVLENTMKYSLRKRNELRFFEDYAMEYVKRYGPNSVSDIQSMITTYLQHNISPKMAKLLNTPI